MIKKYDIIYSIGSDCACAKYLRILGLRKASGPFDWVKSAPFESRIELILNKFAGFFEKEDLAFFPPENVDEPGKTHNCQNLKTGFCFIHDFPYSQSLDESYPDVSAKYARRITRFYQFIEQNKKVLLVWFSRTSVVEDEVLKKYKEHLEQKFGKNIELLIIENADLAPHQPKDQSIMLAEGITRYFAETEKQEKGFDKLCGNINAVKPAFSNIKNFTLASFRSKMVRILVKCACVFVANKDTRRKIRDKYKY